MSRPGRNGTAADAIDVRPHPTRLALDAYAPTVWRRGSKRIAALFSPGSAIHLQAPRAAPTVRSVNSLSVQPVDDSHPFALFPQITSEAHPVNLAPAMVRCGPMRFVVAYRRAEPGQLPAVDYDAAASQAANRATFIAHTAKLLRQGGIQGSEPQLLAAANLYGLQIQVWRPTAGGYALAGHFVPDAGPPMDPRATVNLCLAMAARRSRSSRRPTGRLAYQSDASHYRLLQGVTGVLEKDGTLWAQGGTPVDVGGEGECLYFAMAWHRGDAETRAHRANYVALHRAGKVDGSYMVYFSARSDAIQTLHREIAAELAHDRYAAAIQNEVMDHVARYMLVLRRRPVAPGGLTSDVSCP